MRVLVDMDGVIADFEGRFLEIWRAQYPEKAFIPPQARNTPYLIDQYPPEERERIQEIYYAPGFFSSLPPIPGGCEALHTLRQARIEVFICTTPFVRYQNCVGEKFGWVAQHLGPEWIERIILTFDKTLVRGDYLIDDMPVVSGAEKPSWEHILYDDPKNVAAPAKKRLTWVNWKEVLLADEPFRRAFLPE
jgi:5'-nucleotidase